MSSKRKFNKFKRKRNARRRKAYRNREQKLSILTVKRIAKETVQQHPETKYVSTATAKTIGEHPLGPPSVSPAAVSGCKPIVETLLNATTIPLGTGLGQRIGDKIFLKGFRVKAHIKAPRNINSNPLLTGQGLDFIKCYLMIIKSKNAPDLAGNFAETWWEDAYHTALTRKNKYNVIWKKEITINMVQSKFGVQNMIWNTTPATQTNPGIGNAETSHNLQNSVSHPRKPLLNNDFIAINQKTQVGQTSAGDIPNSYFFCAYCIPEKGGMGTDNFFNGEYINGGAWDRAYTPVLNYQITTHYTDS